MSKARDFWSRRRAQVEAEEAAAGARAVAAQEDRQRAELADKPDAEILAEFDLPDPDQIKLGDDITGFMDRAIPERLRRRALRKLWRTNPVLACVDGLNDYDGDFSNAATDAPGVKTAYRVGKGLLRHVEALEREAAEKETPASQTAELEAEAAPVPSALTGKSLQDPDEADDDTTKVVVAQAEIDETIDTHEALHALPRRMRFRFETETE